MDNAITEGNDRAIPPDRHGEIVRAPVPAATELQTEVLDAWRHKEAGEGEAMRARSSIESRADLRLAATNEAARTEPGHAPHGLAIELETARRWVDLDATDFGRIRSDARRENALDAIAGHMRTSPEYADELAKRSPSLATAGMALNAERAKVELEAAERDARDAQNRIEGSIHTRHNRLTMDAEGMNVEPRAVRAATAVDLARQDAEDYRKLERIDNVLGAALAIGEMAKNIAYRKEMERLSPDAAIRAKLLVEREEAATKAIEQEPAVRDASARGDHQAEAVARAEINKRHRAEQRAIAAMSVSALLAYSENLKRASPGAGRAQLTEAVASLDSQAGIVNRDDPKIAATREEREEQLKAAAASRAAVIDAAGLATVAAVRTRESANAARQLTGEPDTSTQQRRDAQQSLKAPPLDGRVTAPDELDIEAQRARAIKRPVTETELSQALLTRFIVSREKRGLLDKGATEFTFRSGEQQGRVAFVDTGKALNTELDDKSTIRSMVEVAVAKNWKEITVSGGSDFRRNAWLEASLNGVRVNGYEPREADKQLLAELQQRAPTNTITMVEKEQRRDDPREPTPTAASAPVAQPHRRHVDGDALTQHEKTVLDNSRSILNSKALGDQFTEATLRELESKLRGERVYIGQIVEHGPAPYKFDKNNDNSYYVTLQTRDGEQVIWGKGLPAAMQGRQVGEQIVLQNVGKRDVLVEERVRDAQGQVVGTRLKESQLNAWKAELLSRFSEKARADLAKRDPGRQPALGVYDPSAPRPQDQRAAPMRLPEQQRNAEQQRGARNR